MFPIRRQPRDPSNGLFQLVLLFVGFLFLGYCGVAGAYTSESPEVQAMINRAIPVLETGNHHQIGGHALMALALLKAEKPTSPKIAPTAQACVNWVAEVRSKGLDDTHYSASMVCIFLSELDNKKYRNEIETLLQVMLKNQQPNGCWGYLPQHTYDDTSQTQYTILCMWSAHHAGIPLPAEAVEKAMMWFVRTQDPMGGWAYQGQDSKSSQRIQQNGVTPAMSAAGMGSLYICADLLGFGKRGTPGAQVTAVPVVIPPALRRKEKDEDKVFKAGPMRPTQTNPGSIAGALTLGNGWFAKNLKYDKDIPWTNYYMYGVERYKSFQEVVEGKPQPEPDWYNEGVRFFQQTQNQNGSWPSSGATGGAPIDTAFAVLFLTRSTKKAIAKTESGRLLAGRDIPEDPTEIRIVKGKIVSDKDTPPIEKLLNMLEDPNNPQGEFILGIPDELTLATDEKTRASQVERLRRMVINGSFQGRLTAVRTLARQRNLDNVPSLIFALTDGDIRIRDYAQDGLRFISRRFTGNEMPPEASPQQIKAIQEKWKQWYLSVRPDGVFVE